MNRKVSNDFDWVVEVSKNVDKELKKLNKRLVHNTIEELLAETKGSLGRNLDHIKRNNTHSASKKRVILKRRWNILVTMYDIEWSKKPWYKRLTQRKIRLYKY